MTRFNTILGKIIYTIILLHNYFFPDTAFDLIGFTKDNDILYAVVQQSNVSINAHTDLKQDKTF